MAHYFIADVHLRLDYPERGLRLARFVDRLDADDALTIVGDLCDFWFATRQRAEGAAECPGLRSLAAFRDRGGTITVLPGNHDLWLGPFYEQTFGARFLPEPMEIELQGLRVHLVHGHLLGARKSWKKGMESRAFFGAFGRLPSPIADAADALLGRVNAGGLEENDRRHLAVYRRYVASLRGRADLVVIGHIHAPRDESGDGPRMVVPGGWQLRSSYLRIDEAGAALVVEPDQAPEPAGLDRGAGRPVS